MEHHHHQIFLLVLVILLPFSSAAFKPAFSYLLNCGSRTPATFSDNSDSRTFVPDSPFLSSSSSSSSSSSVALSNPNPSPDLYKNARFFSSLTSYTFSINKTGFLVVRLHFYPFSTGAQNLSSSVFNASASVSPLLTSFTPQPNSSSASNPLVLKEFFLQINTSSLSISFSSSGFVSAIEVFSAPDELLKNTPKLILPTLPTDYSGLSSQVLETVYRFNVGGQKITPSNDTLWRTWLPDDDNYLRSKPLAMAFQFPGTINYRSDAGPTREIAPPSVYSTCREMNKSGTGATASGQFNLTWNFPVIAGDRYFIRMHFCDIVSSTLDQLVFDSYINGYTAYQDIDLSSSSVSQRTMYAPYYTDSVVDSNGTSLLQVAVGPSTSSTPSQVNAILNGLEIMRIVGVATMPETPAKKRTWPIVVGVVLGCLVLIGVILLGLVALKRRKRNTQEIPQEHTSLGTASPFLNNAGGRAFESPLPNLNLELKIPIEVIMVATNNFDKESEIGSGGFGKVYRGVLPDGRRIAAKRGSRQSGHGRGQGEVEFYTEILVLSKIRHRHLVSLIGYCEEQSDLILVYEFMEKGTLRDHLYGSRRPAWPALTWKQRLEICIGTAKGLHYLHTESASQAVIHRDVKSANILLDENYVAKVADFGISKSGPLVNETHVSTIVKGSIGYLDPEYHRTLQLTQKSDVFSFGVVLLEVLCARRAIDNSLPWEQQNLAEWGMKILKSGQLEQIIDPVLKDNINPNSLRKFGETIGKCLAPYGVDRPSMGDVLWNLDYALKLQETGVSRDPYEDSITGVSTAIGAGMSPGRPFPPMEIAHHVPATGAEAETGTLDSQVTTSQVFSQLISSQGR